LPSTQIPKSGPVSDPSGYRPISLNATVSKVMEKIIRDQILTHCLNKSLISSHQFGFLPRRSVEIQLLSCLNEWTKSIDSSIPVDVLYVDLSKAFDTVPHQKLLTKLQAFGIKGKLFDWLESYLIDRWQSVRVNTSQSQKIRVSSGVPQGSVKGPLLFLLYINDLPQIFSHCKVAIYADDIKLYSNVKNQSDQINFQSDIDKLFAWTQLHQLTISPIKSAMLHLGGKLNSRYPYLLNKSQIPVKETYKDLGVLIDSDLTFIPHINEIVKKANQMKGALKRSFHSRSPTFHQKMFTVFVRSRLEFCTAVWSPHQLYLAKQVESVQRSFLKYLKPDSYLKSYVQRCEESFLHSLLYRRVINDLVIVYKLVHGGFDGVKFEDFFTLAPSIATRGHTFKIQKQTVNKTIRGSFFSGRVVDVWNALSQFTVECRSLKCFKLYLVKNDTDVINNYILAKFPRLLD
jgi:hypothetical protein